LTGEVESASQGEPAAEDSIEAREGGEPPAGPVEPDERSLGKGNRGRECVCMSDNADRFLSPFFWHDISIVLIEVQSNEDSRLGNEQRRF
jgi:hypothetical protein